MKSNFLTEDRRQDRHAQTLRHCFTKDAEATMGDSGTNETAKADDQENDAHQP